MKCLRISNPKNLTVFPLLGENKKLNDLSITAPNLIDLKGIGQCTNLKTISLSNNKNLNTVEHLENIKFVDIKLNRSGIKNLDFLENTQIISSYNHSIGYILNHLVFHLIDLMKTKRKRVMVFQMVLILMAM